MKSEESREEYSFWNMPISRIVIGLSISIGSFMSLGTVAALWENPIFIRMTPVGEFEITMLALMSVLFGIFVAIPMTVCGRNLAGSGGIVGFLGLACPICNKILLLLFGSELLLTYMEPARLYLAGAGVVMTMLAVLWKFRVYRTAAMS